jgi:hypothetical protein
MTRARFFACILFVLIGKAAHAAQCDFQFWFDFKGTKIYRNPAHTAYLYATDHSRIDADGAPNAYHPDDIGKNCLKDPHRGLDCPANAGYPKTRWWPQVLVPDPNDALRAYEQKTGEFKGFFVAKTWLTGGVNIPPTNPAKYVDSRRIPYLVFPGSTFAQLAGTGSKGDIGFAWHIVNGKKTSFIVVAQGGGEDARLGEGSIALYEALGGKNLNPRNGSGVAPGRVRFLLFPGSRKMIDFQKSWPLTKEMIDKIAAARLENVGGEAAIEACSGLP